jgi:raffinose/stachyose/melibiose transport system substrate-binding protein
MTRRLAHRRTRVIQVLPALCLVTAVAAVAAFASHANAAGTKTQAGGNVTIWTWQPPNSDYVNIFQAAGDRYKGAGGGSTTINSLDFNSYFTKFKTASAGGDVPDLMEMSWTGDYHDVINAGDLLPLDSYLKDFPKFFAPTLNSLRYKGHVYGVPLDVNTLTIGYNKAIFQKLHLKVPKTFQQLLALAKPIRKAGYQPLSVNLKDGWPGGDLWFAQVAYTDKSENAIRQAEQGAVKWTDPRFVQATANVKKLQTSGLLANGANSLDFTSAISLFARGQAAMTYPVGNFDTGLIDQASHGKVKYDLFAVPPPNVGQKPLATGGPAIIWSIPKNAKNPQGAIAVLKAMMSAQGTTALVDKNYIPAYPADISSNKSPIYHRMVSFQATAQTRAIFIPNVYNTLLNGVSALLNGTTTPTRLTQGMERAYNSTPH